MGYTISSNCGASSCFRKRKRMFIYNFEFVIAICCTTDEKLSFFLFLPGIA
jgi:hypothetical protein